jgi:hypothetical protein
MTDHPDIPAAIASRIADSTLTPEEFMRRLSELCRRLKSRFADQVYLGKEWTKADLIDELQEITVAAAALFAGQSGKLQREMVALHRALDWAAKMKAERDAAQAALGQRGKPTPEMVEAGAEAIWQRLSDVMPYGSESGRALARAVWEAMREAQEEDGDAE